MLTMGRTIRLNTVEIGTEKVSQTIHTLLK